MSYRKYAELSDAVTKMLIEKLENYENPTRTIRQFGEGNSLPKNYPTLAHAFHTIFGFAPGILFRAINLSPFLK